MSVSKETSEVIGEVTTRRIATPIEYFVEHFFFMTKTLRRRARPTLLNIGQSGSHRWRSNLGQCIVESMEFRYEGRSTIRNDITALQTSRFEVVNVATRYECWRSVSPGHLGTRWKIALTAALYLVSQ